jgi:pimeloyl-ACP methyl ester carboxylesterase
METLMKSGQLETNGLQLHYEVHGEGRPLVLLHGALSATQSSFGKYISHLARAHRVISLEMQAHGHTADIDRPLRIGIMADDTVVALGQLGVEEADFYGYSMGAGIAFDIAIRHPKLVRKLVLASFTFNQSGFHPGLLASMAQLRPEHLAGSPWQQEYARVAPNPNDFPRLLEKVKDMNRNLPQWSEDEIRSIEAPTLIVVGDSDVVPEHSVQLFRLLGGGASGDTTAGLPKSRLAMLPATSHTMMVDRAELLLPILSNFLDDPAC